MSEEKQLRESLIAAFEHLKEQDALISTLMCQSVALQEAALDGNLERIVRFEEALAREMKDATPKIVASVRVYDLIIELLKTDARWLN